jgi:mono/diheme cytochrome c family protein
MTNHERDRRDRGRLADNHRLMKKLLTILGALLGAIVLLAGAAYAWASIATGRKLARTYPVHSVDFAVPFPLGESDAAAVPEGDRARVATERALERARHLLQARYGCAECHGQNFGGGTMIDAPVMGRVLGPNLTRGRGSRTAAYRPADWDRIVRHGVLPDGRPAAMPSEEFRLMSDQELSDIVAYITSRPPVDNEVPAPAWGPIGKMLIATGRLPLGPERVGSIADAHPVTPPPADASVEFGRHVAGSCMGCHRENYAGGPILGGDPSWPPARNLTRHAEGLSTWTYDQFVTAMREGRRPDGTAIRPPMTLITPYAKNVTEVEMQALWAFLRSLPPAPTNE